MTSDEDGSVRKVIVGQMRLYGKTRETKYGLHGGSGGGVGVKKNIVKSDLQVHTVCQIENENCCGHSL